MLSWFPIGYDSPMRKVQSVLESLTEPVLAPLRRVIPPVQFGGMGLDMSFLVLTLAIFVLLQVLAAF